MTSNAIKSGSGIPNKIRLAALCLICLLFSANSYAQNKNVTINAVNQPISSVLEQIEQQGVYSFFYNNRVVKLDNKVSISANNAAITKVLDEILRGTNISYSIVEDNIVLSVKSSGQAAQPARLQGKIVDKSGEPVIGATVIIDGTTQGTNTNIDGEFSFPWNENISSAMLNVSFIGYAPQQIAVNNRTMIDVTLEEDRQEIETVVVTALGIRREERAVTYNVQELPTDIFNTKDANLVNSLAGRVAGVTVNASSAGVGGETRVVVRGNKSIYNGNNALYVLDGIPLPSLSLTKPGDSYSIYDGSLISGDGISNFNSEDFDNMTVLAGPSAAALYGYKAANGVVMLGGRQAKEGISLTYSNNTTFMTPFWMPEFQNNYGQREGSYASWGAKLSSPNTGWTPSDFFQTGYNTSHSIGLGIGKESSSTYLSLGTVDARGLIKNNDYGRYNVTFNHSNSFLKDKMTLSLTGMYMHIEEQNMLAGGEYYNPLIPVYLMSPGDDINKYAIYERYDPSRNLKTQYWPWGSLGLSMQNPYWIMNRNMFNTGKDRFIFGASLKYDITDWLSVSGRARIDYNHSLATQKNYASTNTLFAGTFGRYYENHHKSRQIYGDVMVNFNKSFACDRLTVQAAIGASVEDDNYRGTMLGGDLTTATNLFALANIQLNKSQATSRIMDQNQAVFGTAQIGWDRKVYLDVTARTDWNSAMAGTNNSYILYPSVGLSGIITDIFNIDSKVLSFLKLRASYAEVGNPAMHFLTITTHPIGGYDGPLRSDMFEPELTKSWEVGMDIRLWGNKFIGNVTYYNSRTYNQVFTPTTSSTNTSRTVYINAGRVDNKGIEVKAELNQNIGPVEWNSTVIYSRNRNKIKQMFNGANLEGIGPLAPIDSLTMGGASGFVNVLKNGGSIGDIYVNTLKTDEHGYVWVAPMTSTVDPDRNNYVYAGNVAPSYSLSWNNGFEWNGLRLNFMITARVGGIGISLTQAAMDYYGVSKRTGDARDNGGALVNNMRIPAENFYQTIGGSGANLIGAYYIYSMTNVRLGEVVLGYDIPINKWVPWIKGLNVSFIGKNLLMLYCKAPFDPELVAGAGTYTSGIDYFMMPSNRSLGFSVKLTF